MPSCPGVTPGGAVCTPQCQRAVCEALAGFFRATYNETNPWDFPGKWIETLTRPCSELVPAVPGVTTAASPPPPYCSWRGVACCGSAAAAAGACGPVHGVANLTVRADNLNGSVSDPRLIGAVEQLHACGLRGFNLESNELSGELGPRWGRLVNLTELNLGECSECSECL